MLLLVLLSQSEAMGLLESWYQLAEKVGIGAAFVLGVVCVGQSWVIAKLWNTEQGDKLYHREQDKQTLVVLQGLTSVLQTQGSAATEATDRVIEAIKELRQQIFERIGK